MPDQSTDPMSALTRGVSLNLYGSAFNMMTRLLFNVLVARLLGPSEVGIYFIALSVANLLSVLAVGGLDTTLVRYLSRQRLSGDWGGFRGTLRIVLQTGAGLGICAAVFMLVGASWIATIAFHNQAVAAPLRIVSFWIPLFVAENLLLAATQSFREMKYKLYIDSLLDPSLRFVLVIVVYLLGGGLNAILTAYVSSLFVCAILAGLALRRCVPVRLTEYPATANRRELLAFSYPLFSYNVLTALVLYLDSLLMAHFRSPAEVGMYSVCIRLVAVTGFITPVLGQIFGPICSELHHSREYEQLAASVKVVTLLAVQMFLPVLLLFIAMPQQILEIFGNGFRGAATCLLVLMLGQSANYLTGPTGLVLNMAGWTRLELGNIAFIACLQTVLNLFLIPSLGILGGALASCTALVTLNLLQLYQMNRRLRFHPFSTALAKPFLAALAALVVIVLVPNLAILGSSLGAVLKSCMMILAYGVTLAVLGLDRHTSLALEHVRGVIWRRPQHEATVPGSNT
jgi:O-antigen/teichoic acid export membrane protein